jgi:hypothetical protein
MMISFKTCVRLVRVRSKMGATGELSLTLGTMEKHIHRYSLLKQHDQLESNLVTIFLDVSNVIFDKCLLYLSTYS